MRYRVTNLTRNTLLADRGEVADSFFKRFKGLMGVSDFPLGRALHIAPCNSIHMFFMKIPLDIVFLDRELTVVEVLHALPPWRVSRVYFAAHSALELPAGTARATGTAVGDRLSLTPDPAP